MNTYFVDALKNTYIFAGYVSMQNVLDSESKFTDIRPLTDTIKAYENDIDNLNNEECKKLVNGLVGLYDLQAVFKGSLKVLRETIASYFYNEITTIKKHSNRFFKEPTNDIRDIFTIEDVNEIFKISTDYTGSIRGLIKRNRAKLIDNYLAREITTGIYVFTRAGVQVLLDSVSNNESISDEVVPEPYVQDEEITKVVTAVNPDVYTITSSSTDSTKKEIVCENPLEITNPNVFKPIHDTNDYHMVFLNMIWYFLPYYGMPYFFANNVNGNEVWATQTKELIIFHAEGLRRAIRSYYRTFFREEINTTLEEFIDTIKYDMGYLPDKHSLKFNDKTLNDIFVFDKNVILNYVIDHNLVKCVPDMDRDNWWKKSVDSAYNAEATSSEFIDLARHFSYTERRTSFVDNSNATIVINCLLGESSEDDSKEIVITNEEENTYTPIPGTYAEIAYNTKKDIFLSDVVLWIVENSNTDTEEKEKIKEVYTAITGLSSDEVKSSYKTEEEFAKVVKGFTGNINPIIFKAKV